LLGVLFASLIIAACGSDDATEVFGDSPCDIPSNLFLNGEARAYPHRIGWHHEIVNDRIGDTWVTVSFCPLTGSGIAMDATIGGNRVEFGLSGLLFSNNLTMFDRITNELYGPQLSIERKCERFRGASPNLIAIREMSWGRWKELYPETAVVSSDNAAPKPYLSYPYGSYDQLNDNSLLFPQDNVDTSHPLKERVLAIRSRTTGGRGYPFSELAALGGGVTLNDVVDGAPVAIFYEIRSGESAVAYDRVVAGQTLTFEMVD
jgi:hypothetical protein